ncbi:Uncharacterized membrane protein [Cribrihabitans marinus]|uniref:Uncharacterized membrane protein n=1 Tax=Cribrihabitans marinus TaxID=1227549 RepID=A0A1H6ZRX0_9RHOB|nr:DUF2244 domain-containing protein [Cribrihabitans marinus]GGH30123.1 hypothetical protein GCM10010973_20020 [Cribrihabitans marinus]SEJ56219.1 Uncharacterized membrane protein [Cribrihabitans marinus]
MPYRWTTTPSEDRQELQLWPHNSLPPRGFAASVLGLFTLAMIPVFTLLGSVLLWGILPFVLIAIGGIWWALQVNYRSRRVLEVLTLSQDTARLERHNPRGPVQSWDCNRYWARPEMHEADGPVPYYVTLNGSGREVEIGAFLSEEERRSLYDDLSARLPGRPAPLSTGPGRPGTGDP